MKVKFNCDSGANIHSCRTDTLDTVEDLGLEEGEWEAMDDEAKDEILKEWAWERIEMWWDEVK